ncbi:SDR family NAD(P)-dependent oxidoreductase [Lysinibacillus fusiformis]|uniref:SDR family NAD(P)-dependent oxidoreductase n=1 Tax=Lysinibacillus fusiformis TaxID=28031 RepID=UPI0000F3ABAB|nr:SDR family NAD(P)-dependent oxidoreductase [Lysinibacillus fusiformis]EAZ85195.1 YqjQ [Bacillus sp. B14905]MED4076810.1 SDR family NAD(P)-dependent oxidoreductase [Lysinibacillus fusiformis]
MNSKTIFVTGATSGVGLKITELLVAQGHTVYATGRNAVALKVLERLGAKVIQADLTHLHTLDAVCAQLPPIDVAILSAGVGKFAEAPKLMDEDIAQMIEVNISVPIYLAKRLASKMMEQNQGHLIFIGSQAGKVATPKASVYAATKHAIVGFTNGLRMELAPYHVKVTAIHPGPIDTPFLDKANDQSGYRESLGRFLLSADEVAQATIKTIERPVREVNLPKIMGLSSKLYALAPATIELLGKSFFHKK